MALVAPTPSRVQVIHEPGRLRVVVRVPRSWPTLLFLGAWLGGWVAGEAFAVSQLFLSGRPEPIAGQAFLLFWLVMWTVGGVFAMYTLAWGIVGREEITVDGRVLAIRQAAGPIGRTRQFDLAHVQDLHPAPTDGASTRRFGRLAYPGMDMGEIAFSYGAKNYRLGIGIEGADVKLVLAALRERMPEARVAAF